MPAPAPSPARLVALVLTALVAMVLTTTSATTALGTTATSHRARADARVTGSSYSLWSGTGRYDQLSAGRRTVGTTLRVARSGLVSALRVYAPRAGSRYRLSLYSGTGVVLASASTGRGHAGWRSAVLRRPVEVERSRTYVVASTSTGPHATVSRVRVRHGSLRSVGAVVGQHGSFPTTETRGAALVDVVYSPLVGPFPTAATTGGPPVSSLRRYTGPCTLTRDGTVIEHRLITCDLEVEAADVVVEHSVVHGTISSGDDRHSGYSFSLVHSTVDASPDGVDLVTGVGDAHFRVVASEIVGGNRGVNCWYDCVVRDSWVHGQDRDASGQTHESGVRMGQHSVIVDNRLTCDAPDVPPDAGCSAALTGYGDFAPVRDDLVSGNYFPGTTGGTCAYGGSSAGKPYSDGAAHVRFTDNIFGAGSSGNCGYWAPIMDFDRSAPGNEWTGNAWSDGGPVTP